MTSSTEDNKRLALDKLRFSRNTQANHDQMSTSSSATAQEISQRTYFPPPQSRDGSVSSHFFPSSPPSLGNALVPNSSPISQNDYPIHSYQTYGHLMNHNMVTSSNPFSSSTWLSASLGSAFDPLSAPGGLISHGGLLNATSRRRLNDDDDVRYEDGPPRKRVNRGLSEDVPNVPRSPSSPEIRRIGHRGHILAIGADAVSISSDDSTQESWRVDAVSKPRLTKERPASSPDTTPMPDAPPDREYISFKISHPTESPVRVEAAWKQASGDANKATVFLLDPGWSPSSFASRGLSSRIKELDDATRAQRAAEKEKGKKSMIYANRSILDTRTPVTPSPSKPVNNLVAPTPASPISQASALKAPQRKRAKKLVINSDSDSTTDETGDERASQHGSSVDIFERRALDYLNTSNSDALQELIGCTSDQAQTIISLRPFTSGDDIRSKVGQGKKKATGISPRMFEECTEMFKVYGSVDNILEDCEQIGSSLRATIDSWSPSKDAQSAEDGAVSFLSLGPLKKQKNYLTSQPSLLSDTVTLKEYQLLGVNWLNLLYHSNLSCILADEMGLGKTIQVISFLSFLKQKGNRGPHLIVVPSSTLENWCREFARFSPSIAIQTYYGEKNDRAELRQSLRDTQRRKEKPDGWEVLITTYNLAQGDERDRHFFRKLEWDCCIYDEGHVLKNFQSQRYQSLLKFPYNWRLLLTGTPLQNNLQELVSLLNFILPDQFAESLEHLRAIFKVKGDAKVSLLSQERISRAKKMMTPFVLRRRKDQVLKDLPTKTERIEWCEMTELQRSIYHDTLQRSRKTILISQEDSTTGSSGQRSKKIQDSNVKRQTENSTNVLMDLRKAASHPMLFRSRFTDEALAGITNQLLKESDFKKRGARYDFVMEDMSVMTDAELQVFCATYKSTRKYLQDEACYADAGKVQVLLRLLAKYTKEQRKVLIFSQFTQILDILQAVLRLNDIKFLVLTGSTPVDIRQTLVDEFTEDGSISVFLLSTKAGGMGINLTAASAVIMFDQDFNPHNDRQAQDRAYRIGQKRDVEVVKLISKGTIEEDMLQLGATKLALDEAVAGDSEKGGECAPERTMKTSLMNTLRQHFEKDEGLKRTVIAVPG